MTTIHISSRTDLDHLTVGCKVWWSTGRPGTAMPAGFVTRLNKAAVRTSTLEGELVIKHKDLRIIETA